MRTPSRASSFGAIKLPWMKDGKPAVLFSVLLVLTSRTKEDLYGYRFFTMYGYRHGIDVDECALATGQAWDPSTDLVADDGGGRGSALCSFFRP